MEMATANLCQICNTSEFKYTCPKCNKLYCSLICYRAPSHQECSEIFYRDCVTEELAMQTCSINRNDSTNIEEAKKMYEILKRMEATMQNDVVTEPNDVEELGRDGVEESCLDSDDEDGNDLDLATRLHGICLDDPDAIWANLTANERQEFQNLLKTGDIQKIIPQTVIWWEIQVPKQLIKDITDNNSSDITKLRHPPLIENISSFASLMKKPPSPCLPNNLYNILASYACTVRYYNDEHHLTPMEATKYLIENSATLSKSTNFDDTEQAVKSVIAECNNWNPGAVPSWESIACDVELILAGPYEEKRVPVYVRAALSDVYRLIDKAKSCLKMKGPLRLDDNLDRKVVKSTLKKIEFFLSFVNETKSDC